MPALVIHIILTVAAGGSNSKSIIIFKVNLTQQFANHLTH